MSYVAEIHIWSRIGHTPLTKRRGLYCDLLHKERHQVRDIEAAKKRMQYLLRITPHSCDAHFAVLEHPNQNLRTQWMKRDR